MIHLFLSDITLAFCTMVTHNIVSTVVQYHAVRVSPNIPS